MPEIRRSLTLDREMEMQAAMIYARAPLTLACPSCDGVCDKHEPRFDGKPSYHCRNPQCRQPWPFGVPRSIR